MITLTSMASKASGMREWYLNERPDDPISKRMAMQGDIVNTLIKCAGGETILLTHDCTLPRPYSRGGRVQGTKGLWMEDNRSYHIEGIHPPHQWAAFDEALSKYQHPLWCNFDNIENSRKHEGHGGMDYFVIRAFIESVQNGTNPPIDVYDAAAWMAVTCLSEQSIAMGSIPVPIPDFTNGKWLARTDVPYGQYALL